MTEQGSAPRGIPSRPSSPFGGRVRTPAKPERVPPRWQHPDLLRLLTRISHRSNKVHRVIVHAPQSRPGFSRHPGDRRRRPLIAAVFVAEIGDVHRFKSPQALCSWAGLTPRHPESDTKVMRGKITKQGSRIVRCAAIEAISKQRGGAKVRADHHAITERRGKQKVRVTVG